MNIHSFLKKIIICSLIIFFNITRFSVYAQQENTGSSVASATSVVQTLALKSMFSDEKMHPECVKIISSVMKKSNIGILERVNILRDIFNGNDELVLSAIGKESKKKHIWISDALSSLAFILFKTMFFVKHVGSRGVDLNTSTDEKGIDISEDVDSLGNIMQTNSNPVSRIKAASRLAELRCKKARNIKKWQNSVIEILNTAFMCDNKEFRSCALQGLYYFEELVQKKMAKEEFCITFMPIVKEDTQKVISMLEDMMVTGERQIGNAAAYILYRIGVEMPLQRASIVKLIFEAFKYKKNIAILNTFEYILRDLSVLLVTLDNIKQYIVFIQTVFPLKDRGVGISSINENKFYENLAEVAMKSKEKEAAQGEKAHTCPITMSSMQDPVLASDGYVYEREALNEAKKNNLQSPMTKQKLLDHIIPLPDLMKRLKAVYVEESKKSIENGILDKAKEFLEKAEEINTECDNKNNKLLHEQDVRKAQKLQKNIEEILSTIKDITGGLYEKVFKNLLNIVPGMIEKSQSNDVFKLNIRLFGQYKTAV